MTDVLNASPPPSPVGQRTVSDGWRRIAGHLRNRAPWRPTLPGVITILVAAVGIPLIAQSSVDGPVRYLDHRGLWVLGTAATALAVSETVMFAVRRRLDGHARVTADVLQTAVVTGCLLALYWPLGLVVSATIMLYYLHESIRRSESLAAPWRAVLEVIPNLAGVVLLGHGAYAVRHGLITMGTLVAFLMMTLSLVGPVIALSATASGRRSSAG